MLWYGYLENEVDFCMKIEYKKFNLNLLATVTVKNEDNVRNAGF